VRVRSKKKLPKRSNESPQMVIVHKDAIDNIMFLKQQQWRVTNYAIAIYAAIFAVFRAYPPVACERVALAFIVMAVFSYSSYLLAKLQWSMTKYRRRLARINSECFTDKEVEDLELFRDPKKYFHDGELLIVLIAASLIGAGLNAYYLVLR
jgi:hypothetical protein